MEVQIWGSSLACGFLATRLKLAGIDVTWFRDSKDARLNRLRPARIGKAARENFRTLQKDRLRPLHLWLQSAHMKTWSFPDEPAFKPIGVIAGFESDDWVSPKVLFEELEAVVKSADVKVKDVGVDAFQVLDFQNTKILQVLDAEPESLAAFKGVFFPDRLQRAHLFCRQWNFESVEGRAGIEFHQFSGARGTWETFGNGESHLTLFAASSYALDRAEISLGEPRGASPMSWKAGFLNFKKREYQEGVLPIGSSHLEVPGIFALGRSFGTFRVWANMEIDYELRQAERLFRTLYHIAELKGPQEGLQSWNRKESSRFRRTFERSRLAESLFFSRRFANLISSASMFLPRSLRHYLNVPV
jgi:hypothetical protein